MNEWNKQTWMYDKQRNKWKTNNMNKGKQTNKQTRINENKQTWIKF